MELSVREMTPQEAHLVIDYFHNSTPEHLEMLGVDPSRLPERNVWQSRFESEHAMPPDKRQRLALIWLGDGVAAGFSTCDKIIFGERANMHLHVLEPGNRQKGIGVECVRKSADIYFETLKLKKLFCEPNAFNIGPNRTLQKAGFKYLKTHMTVPGPLNYHQAVTRWVLER